MQSSAAWTCTARNSYAIENLRLFWDTSLSGNPTYMVVESTIPVTGDQHCHNQSSRRYSGISPCLWPNKENKPNTCKTKPSSTEIATWVCSLLPSLHTLWRAAKPSSEKRSDLLSFKSRMKVERKEQIQASGQSSHNACSTWHSSSYQIAFT